MDASVGEVIRASSIERPFVTAIQPGLVRFEYKGREHEIATLENGFAPCAMHPETLSVWLHGYVMGRGW